MSKAINVFVGIVLTSALTSGCIVHKKEEVREVSPPVVEHERRTIVVP